MVIVGRIRVRHGGKIIDRPIIRILKNGKYYYHYTFNMVRYKVCWNAKQGKFYKK